MNTVRYWFPKMYNRSAKTKTRYLLQRWCRPESVGKTYENPAMTVVKTAYNKQVKLNIKSSIKVTAKVIIIIIIIMRNFLKWPK